MLHKLVELHGLYMNRLSSASAIWQYGTQRGVSDLTNELNELEYFLS